MRNQFGKATHLICITCSQWAHLYELWVYQKAYIVVHWVSCFVSIIRVICMDNIATSFNKRRSRCVCGFRNSIQEVRNPCVNFFWRWNMIRVARIPWAWCSFVDNTNRNWRRALFIQWQVLNSSVVCRIYNADSLRLGAMQSNCMATDCITEPTSWAAKKPLVLFGREGKLSQFQWMALENLS